MQIFSLPSASHTLQEEGTEDGGATLNLLSCALRLGPTFSIYFTPRMYTCFLPTQPDSTKVTLQKKKNVWTRRGKNAEIKARIVREGTS
jgi:hypothetical protein